MLTVLKKVSLVQNKKKVQKENFFVGEITNLRFPAIGRNFLTKAVTTLSKRLSRNMTVTNN